MRLSAALFLASALIYSGASAASITVGIYEQARAAGTDIGKGNKSYINGVGNGYAWANGELANRSQPLLFCAPDKLALTEDNFVAILNDEIDKHPGAIKGYSDDTPIEFILLHGLQHVFPCPATPK
jgi:hypothetical protein